LVALKVEKNEIVSRTRDHQTRDKMKEVLRGKF